MSRSADGAVIGIDVGTSELKAGLLDCDGRLLGIARRAYPTDQDSTGRAEQDPEAWWKALVECVCELPVAAVDVGALCVVGQGPTLVATNGTGEPVRRAITWLDRRAAGRTTGRAADYGLLTRMAWLAAAEPGSVRRARWLQSSWDSLGLRLSGVAGTALQRHEHPLPVPDLQAAGVDASRVPPVVGVGEPLGPIVPEVAHQLGLRPTTLVVAGTNDGTASILGAGLLEPGDAVDTGGASGGFGVYLDRPLSIEGVFSAPAPIPRRWVLGGAMAATGAALGWLHSSILAERWRLEELLDEALRVSEGADGLLFLPYLAGERAPIWDQNARGVFSGLTLAHGRAHLVRAVVEASALAVRHVAEPILAAGASVRELRLAGGPARAGAWAQTRADITGWPVAVPKVGEIGVLGAAILAAAGAGLVDGLADGLRRMTGVAERFSPRPEATARYDVVYARYRALYAALSGVFAELARIATPPAQSQPPARS